MIKAFVGAGGKTSLIRQNAKEYISHGWKVFVTTSTRMYIEENTMLTDHAEEIIRELEEKHYVMAGIPDGEKIKPLSYETYEKVCQHADVVLVEADGSKHMPLKFPDISEPVIYDNVDEIVVVYGLHALYRRAEEVVHRLYLADRYYPLKKDTLITKEHMENIVMKGYVEPLRKKYPKKEICVQPNLYIGDMKLGCVIMASGMSRRFGKNKLLEEFQGKTLIQRVLDITGGDLFTKRLVVTRSVQVKELCEQQHVDVVFHDLPNRNDTVRLGVREMKDMDGCIFCPCDQPLLKKESLERMAAIFLAQRSGMVRLSFGGKQGAPILFGKEYFQELSCLPEKAGGSCLVKRYPDKLRLTEASDKLELFDVDTRQDFEVLKNLVMENGNHKEKGELPCLQ
ncbi:MAG: selenium cofactor biosynthesis protein YqeC [Oliverpabstia sp.]